MTIIKNFNQFINEGLGGDVASLKQRVYDDIRAFAEKYKEREDLYDEAVHTGFSKDENLPIMSLSFDGMYSVTVGEHDDDELNDLLNSSPIESDGMEIYPVGCYVLFNTNGIDAYFDGFSDIDDNEDIHNVRLEDIDNLDVVEEILDLLEREWL
jgi:hypothetical protein